MNTQSIASIDIGGTKTAVALVSVDGVVQNQLRFATEVNRGPDDLVRRIRESLSELANQTQLVGVGVSAPGPLSSQRGIFLNPPNMPGYHNYPIKQKLEDAVGLPVELMNDANAAAYAEYKFGAGRGTQTMIFFTMSTGMGAGLVIGGRLHEGLDDMAGEVGHTRIAPDGPVGFGVRGSLEGFCSGPGIAQLAVTKLTQALHAEETSLLFKARDDWRLVDAVDVGKAAQANDKVALACFQEVGQKLGEYLASLVDLLNPEAIVLGTIGRIHHNLIVPEAMAVIQELAHPAAAQRVKIVGAALEDELPYLAGAAAFMSRNDPETSPT